MGLKLIMLFVDEATIFVKAGDGGKGCESFYRDKYMRHPKPDGGDGGKGGDVILITDRNVHTLLDFKYRQHHKASKGGNGGSQNKKGRGGADCFLKVPIGTIVRDPETGLLIKDLTVDHQQVIVVRGGAGGQGNANHKVPAPAEAGEERRVALELKLIADVGLVGFPNAGKSTLISKISKVKSKIANYPFTTKRPFLGIVEGDDFNFIVADLPGIIEGAHKGRGLGDRFLRHAERTRILVHVIDMAGSEGRDPVQDFEQMTVELKEYSDEFLGKHRLVVANKMDLPGAEEHLSRFRKQYRNEVFAISALERKGLEPLLDAIRAILCQENSQDPSNVS